MDHAHDFGAEWTKDASGHWKECECGEKDEFAVHVLSDWIVDFAATETLVGSKHKECTVCKETLETETIPATGTGHVHIFSTSWKHDVSSHWHECDCGAKSDVAVHSAGDWVIDFAATAIKAGSKHKECTVCGYIIVTETIPLDPPTADFTNSHSSFEAVLAAAKKDDKPIVLYLSRTG